MNAHWCVRYDTLIEDTLTRLHEQAEPKKCSEKTYLVVVILLSVIAAGLGAVVFIQHRKYTGT